MMGRRALEDPRNRLVEDFVNLVSELDARTFVFENVKGLTVGAHRAFLVELVQAFDAAGYDVRLPWRVLDAANFGVPQHRERLILFGAKERHTASGLSECANEPGRSASLGQRSTHRADLQRGFGRLTQLRHLYKIGEERCSQNHRIRKAKRIRIVVEGDGQKFLALRLQA